MKSRVLSRKVHHCPQCARSQHGRGHPLNPGHEESFYKDVDVTLGTGSFVHHLNQFLSRDGKTPGHFLSEKRTLSTERRPRLHTSATTMMQISFGSFLHMGGNDARCYQHVFFCVSDTQYRKPCGHLPLRGHPVLSASVQNEAMWKLRLEIWQTKRVCRNGSWARGSDLQ